jgi:phosphoribosylamine--glycine ligase
VAAREGERLPELNFADRATVCKYAVPAGYPTDPESGARIEVDEESVARAAETSGTGEALLFYASVDAREDGLYTTTSRAFAVVGVDETVAAAEAIAEAALGPVGDGLRVRHDVGTAALVQRRIDHVAALRD